MMLMRTAKSCGSDAPMLASSLREEAQATVSNKPGHRGEREVSRKTIARGMPGETGVTVVTNSCVCFFTHEAAGALGIRHSLRPLFSERAKQFCKTRAQRAARSRCFIRKQRCLKIESAHARKRVTFPLGRGIAAFAALRVARSSLARCAALQRRRTSEGKHAAFSQQIEKTFVPALLSCAGKLASRRRSGVHEQAGRNSQTGIYLQGAGSTGFRTQEFLAGKSRRVGTARA